MSRLLVIGPVLLLASSGAVLAQAPAGPEFRVSSGATVRSNHPSISADAAGNFVVAWSRYDPPASSVHARMFDPQGAPRGGDIVVVQYAGSPVTFFTRTASEPTGAFVVVWDAFYGQSSSDVFARQFSAAGLPVGAAFRVNTYTSGVQARPVVAKEPDGTFVVVWSDDYGGPPALARVIARRFAADGSPLGVEFAVRQGATADQVDPTVATDGAGNFVVAWDGYKRIEGQRFSAAGTPLGAPFQVNTNTLAPVNVPSVAVQPGGRFMVAWRGILGSPAVVARRYEADGTPLGADFVVRYLNGNVGWATNVAAASLPSGGFMVSWSNVGADADEIGVEAKRFDSAGNPMGRSFVVNSTESDIQMSPAIAADAAGKVAAVWLYRVPLGVFDVYGQRFGLLGTPALAVDTAAGGTSDGNRVLESGETVDLRPTWQNNTSGPLALQGTLASLTGPAGPTYTIEDGAGSYGTVPVGGTQPCIDCYRIGVTASSRPATHWDAIAAELIEDGTDGQMRWRVHVGESFDDVPRSSAFYRFAETLLHRGVTAGCATSLYCPGSPVTREQLAVLVLAAKEERAFVPQFCAFPLFQDVPASSPFCRWIEELARRGVTGGCGGGNYCPTAAVSREQMAVFVLRTLDSTLDPPACTMPIFNDVPASSPFCRWIEELARRGVVSGCGGGSYCPAQPVTREQMSVFITATFGLTLYGP